MAFILHCDIDEDIQRWPQGSEAILVNVYFKENDSLGFCFNGMHLAAQPAPAGWRRSIVPCFHSRMASWLILCDSHVVINGDAQYKAGVACDSERGYF